MMECYVTMNIPINTYSGNSFIDENHDHLIDHINVLAEMMRDQELEKFKSGFQDFIVNLENHFSHEETILRGADYKHLDTHSIDHRSLSIKLRIDSMDINDYDSALSFLISSRAKIFTHELIEDQKYWPLFEVNFTDEDQICLWSEDLETGDRGIDEHHKALLNLINRLHKRFSFNLDVKEAGRELRALRDYSEFHFSEEEGVLGEKLHIGHKVNHESLISDLNILIKEIEGGDFALENIGSYLKYWLLNHIKTFDIPSFNYERKD